MDSIATMHKPQFGRGHWRFGAHLDSAVCPYVLSVGNNVRVAATVRQHVWLLVHQVVGRGGIHGQDTQAVSTNG